MKFVFQKATIDVPKNDPLQTIESRARICYKSEERITKDSAEPFVARMLRHRHMTVMEMSSLALFMPYTEYTDLNAIRFIDAIGLQDDRLVVVGTIRALMELVINNPDHEIARNINGFFRYKLQVFNNSFIGDPINMPNAIDPETPGIEAVMDGNVLWHSRRLTFRIVTNRAISHELVRHRPINVLQESQRYVKYQDDIEFIWPEPYIPLNRDEWSDIDRTSFHAVENLCSSAERMYRRLLADGSPQKARLVLPNATKTELIISATLSQWAHILELRRSKGADPTMRLLADQIYRRIVEEIPGFETHRRIG